MRTIRLGVAAGLLAMCLPVTLAAQQLPPIQNQTGQTLELTPQIAPQTPRQQGQDENTRVIPVIPPNSQVLTLPQASTDFIGKWGGHLQLTHHYGQLRPPDDTIASLLFGSQQGQVVLATYVYGDANSQILKTSADSDGPREVTLTVKGQQVDVDPPVRHVEKLTLTLDGNDRIDARKVVDLYTFDSQYPLAEAIYEGTLRPLTVREDRMLAEEVARHGEVPRAHIQEGNPPPDE